MTKQGASKIFNIPAQSEQDAKSKGFYANVTLAVKCLTNSVCVCAYVCVLFRIKCSTLQIQGQSCYIYFCF